MWLKNLIHKIFEFKPKAQEPISPQELTRKKAWRLDTTILVQGKKNKHQAVGNNSGYIYRDSTCPEDYDCVCIGEFDTVTMSISLIGPKSIIKEA